MQHPRNSVAYTERVNVKIEIVLFANALGLAQAIPAEPQLPSVSQPQYRLVDNRRFLTLSNLEKL